MNNTKGSARDIMLSGIMIFTLAISFITLHYSWGQAAAKMLNNTQLNYSEDFRNSINATTKVTNRLDNIIFVMMIGFFLLTIILSWFVAGNPIFTFIYFLFIIIITIVSAVLSYGWEKIAATSYFSTLVPANFPLTNYILNNFPIFMMAMGFIGMIVMFAKPPQY